MTLRATPAALALLALAVGCSEPTPPPAPKPAPAAAKVTGRGTSECAGAPREATLAVDVPRDSLRGEAVFPPAL